MEYLQNPDSNYTQFSEEYNPCLELEAITNDLMLAEGMGGESPLENMTPSKNFTGGTTGFDSATSRDTLVSYKDTAEKSNMNVVPTFSFRTKTEIEVLDDGYRWRKYGKKAVKNRPNPRHYFKCSSVGCSVKKRVERDPLDASFVITTYDGCHNHECPRQIFYYDTVSLSPHSSSSS